MKNRAGEYRINPTGKLQYKSFVPRPLPPNPPIKIDEDIANLLSQGNRNIGILEGMSRRIPNFELFVSMYIRKEALLSSQIEGTQATLDDILDPEVEENANCHIMDVVNYIRASQYAKERLNELPLCNRLIKETHKILLKDTRGEEQNPGEFRRSQNWIGPPGGTLNNARFIPPNTTDMVDAMSDLEKFMNQDDGMEPLIKAALIHYQFETIHPFLDGNGRIGRLLINLFLMDREILSKETLYVSYFLKQNRIEYYDRLTEVRKKGNFEQWVKFFLLAINETATDAIDTIDRLVKLHDKNIGIIMNMGKARNTIKKVFNYLEGSPIIDIGKTSAELDLSFGAVSNAVNKLVGARILKQTENIQRNRTFAYEEYLDILRKGT